MTYQESNQKLKVQLRAFKTKYYRNQILKGAIFFLALALVSFLLINSLEFSARMNSNGRSLLFFGYLVLVGSGFYHFVGRYILLLKNNNRQISNEEAAIQIGKFFPKISDKLLNVLQLDKLSASQNELLIASILQKSQEIQEIPFTKAIDYRQNKRFAKYALIPAALIILLFLFIPQFITESTTRIVNYNTDYIPEAPFTFNLENERLQGFKGESFTVKVVTEGRSTPESLYLWSNNRKLKASKTGPNNFEYTFNRLQTDTEFILEAENLKSDIYEVNIIERPSIELFNIELNYPIYLNRPKETLQNSGNMLIPEGTDVEWMFSTHKTQRLTMDFRTLGIKEELSPNQQSFTYNDKFKKSTPYAITLENEYSTNKDSLLFNIEVIKDQYPQITFEQYQDTVLFQSIVLAGNISDDYGFSKLSLHYQYEGEEDFKTMDLQYDRNLNSQSYYKVYNLDSSKIKAGSEISYYIQVSDNDGVNGNKSSKTGT